MDKTIFLRPQNLILKTQPRKTYNIVITGKNSRIGNKIEEWLKSHSEETTFNIFQLDVVTDEWKQFDFSDTDVVIHVAAIVHSNCNDWDTYKRVNTKLTVEVAKKAKECKVGQFVFFSTMAVYGIGKELGINEIKADTIPTPVSFYGKSKYLAEQELIKLHDGSFTVTIVRPPNVYTLTGHDYVKTICKITKLLPVLPNVYKDVRQSMIYLDNLTEFIRILVVSGSGGIFLPQDEEPVSSYDIMASIKKAYNKPVRSSIIFGLLVRLLSFIPIVRKAMGGVYYSKELTASSINYIVVPFDEAIKKIVNEIESHKRK